MTPLRCAPSRAAHARPSPTCGPRVDQILALPFLLIATLLLAGLCGEALAQPSPEGNRDEPSNHANTPARNTDDNSAANAANATANNDQSPAAVPAGEDLSYYNETWGEWHEREFDYVRVYDGDFFIRFKINVADPTESITVMFQDAPFRDARATDMGGDSYLYTDDDGQLWAMRDGSGNYLLHNPDGSTFYEFHKDDIYTGDSSYSANPLFGAGFLALLAIIVIGFYVVPAICLGIIAAKVGIENPWLWGLLALVGAIGQAYAIARIADSDIKYAHMVLIGSFIPFIGPFLVIYGLIMLYIDLVQVCGQPSWHCVLALLFSTIYFIYLAVLPVTRTLSNREMRARGMLPPTGPGFPPGGAPPYPGAPGWNPAMAGAPGWNPAMAGAAPGQYAPQPYGYAPPPSNPNDGWESIDDDPDFAPQPGGKPAAMAHPGMAGKKGMGGPSGPPMQRSGAATAGPQRRPGGPGGPGGPRQGPGGRPMPPGAARPGPQGQPRPGQPGQPRPGQPRPGGPQGQRPPGAPGPRPGAPGARPQQRPPQGGPRPPGTPGT